MGVQPSPSGMTRNDRVRWIVATIALGAGCAGEPADAEIAVGYGQGNAPNSITVAAEAIAAAHRPADPRIRLTVDQRPGAKSVTLSLSDEVEHATRVVANTRVMIAVGPGGSREALQAAPIYRDAGVAELLPSATSRLLRTAGSWTFRLAPDDSVQGEFIGRFVAEQLHGRAVMLFYVADEYGLGLSAGTAAALAQRGVHVVDQIPVRPNKRCEPASRTNAYENQVAASLKRGTPDVAIVAGRGWETACIARAAHARVPAARFVGGDGVNVTREFLAAAGPAADSMFLVAFWHPDRDDGTSRAFVANFRRLVGRSPQHGDATWYDAVMLAAQAIREVGADRVAIRSYLQSLGRTRPAYAGVTGPIAFTPEASRPLVMTRPHGTETILIPVR